MKFFSDYQQKTAATAIYPDHVALAYVTMGLVGEAGEIANKVKKIYRDKDGLLDDETRAKLQGELGDVLWYVSQLATELGVELGDVAQQNIDKLASRQERGALTGEGDNR